LKASNAVTIGNKEPSTSAIETNPFVVAIPKSKLARKSAIPMNIKTGILALVKPPTLLNLSAINKTIKTDATRIEVIV
jgi:hypothetical protein